MYWSLSFFITFCLTFQIWCWNRHRARTSSCCHGGIRLPLLNSDYRLNFVIHEGQFTIFDERRGHFWRRCTRLISPDGTLKDIALQSGVNLSDSSTRSCPLLKHVLEISTLSRDVALWSLFSFQTKTDGSKSKDTSNYSIQALPHPSRPKLWS